MQVGNLILSLHQLVIETETGDLESSKKDNIFLIVDYCNRQDRDANADYFFGYQIYDHQTGSCSWWSEELLVGNFKTV